MKALKLLYDALPEIIPILIPIALVVAGLWLANWLLLRRKQLDAEKQFPRRILMIALTILGIVLVIAALPMHPDSRTQVLKLFGLALTAVIAFSSTTFVANGMAGLMLRIVNSFRPGDFIRTEGRFGRVTARGLLHTEIQTEHHDLVTLPNLYLVSHPITVTHKSETIVSATVSLGYDNGHEKIESLLIEAASRAGLEDPFVRITDLGDFSVTYTAAGFLREVKQILTAQSHLRERMLDVLHSAGVEIVSPTFMNQRQLAENVRAMPKTGKARRRKHAEPTDRIPEELIFDKAERAERIEKLRALREELCNEARQLRTKLKTTEKPDRPPIEQSIDQLQDRCEAITEALEILENQKAPTEKND